MSDIQKTILIVEDELDIYDTISSILFLKNINTIHALDGLIGIKKFKENNSISCIVSDISMPNISGVDFIKKVREFNEKIPFIFYTGYGDKSNKIEATKYGAFDFITKPEIKNLINSILAAIESYEDHDRHIQEYDVILNKKK